MKLYLMRHCEAEDGPEMDADRGLTDVGQEQAKVMRKFLKLAGVKPDVIVCSDFARAMETAEEIQRDSDLVFTALLRPDAKLTDAWLAIEHLGLKVVLVVTHSPLIQQLLASVAFCFVDEFWEFHHGAIAYINTEKGRFRWYADPKLAAHLVGEDPKDVETPVGEALIREIQGRIEEAERQKFRRFTENLMADSRRSVIQPLRDQMRTAVTKRWARQLRNVRRALKTHTATDALTAAAVVATAIPFSDPAFAKAHLKVKTAAYAAGVAHAGAQLGRDVNATEAAAKRPLQPSDNLEDDLDTTTVNRAHNALKGIDPFTIAAATAALGTLFAGFTDPGSEKLSRADTVALGTVSDGYHAGMSDTAAQASADGVAVEKSWETEDNPCETCQANAAEGWIPEDAPHDSGDFEPQAHVNCQCSEVYRVAVEDEG